MKRLDHEIQYKWHVILNKSQFGASSKDYQEWLYDAKTIADEVPRLAMLFELERTGTLPKIHQQCSMSEPFPIIDNHLSCCIGRKCKECPYLLILNDMECPPEQLDFIKAWTCATHILTEGAIHPNKFDDSEGYILTVGDRRFWDNVYSSLSQEI